MSQNKQQTNDFSTLKFKCKNRHKTVKYFNSNNEPTTKEQPTTTIKSVECRLRQNTIKLLVADHEVTDADSRRLLYSDTRDNHQFENSE